MQSIRKVHLTVQGTIVAALIVCGSLDALCMPGWCQESVHQKAGDVRYTGPLVATKMFYEGAETVGRVGSTAILKRDIIHQLKKHAYLTWQQQLMEMPEEQRAVAGDALREQIQKEFLSNPKLFSDVLDNYIKKILFYNDFVVSRPKEQVKEQNEKLADTFEREYIPELMKQFKVETRKDLEDYFKNEIQSTLEQEKQIFLHETLGSSWLEFNLGADRYEPTVVELRRYYEANKDAYYIPERVRWQGMTVKIANHATRQEAYAQICKMGNLVLQNNDSRSQEQAFAAVAHELSEDFFAKDGGVHDWTKRDALQSKKIEEALFSTELPPGRLSRVLEDNNQFMIVRILEREEESWKPFTEVQESVREKLMADRRESLTQQYEEALSKRFTIELYNISNDERRMRREAQSQEDQSVTGRDLF